MRYVTCFSWMRSHWIIHCQRCLFTQPRKYKQLGWHSTRGPLLFGVFNTTVWTVLVNICNLELLHFITFNEREVDWHWQYVTYSPLFLVNL